MLEYPHLSLTYPDESVEHLSIAAEGVVGRVVSVYVLDIDVQQKVHNAKGSCTSQHLK